MTDNDTGRGLVSFTGHAHQAGVYAVDESMLLKLYAGADRIENSVKIRVHCKNGIYHNNMTM
jgi:hypothetical protein